MSSKKAKRPTKYKKKQKFKLKAESIQSLIALVLFALAGLTLLAFIGQAAGAGNTLQGWLNGLLGWASFMVPVLCLSLGLFLSQVGWSMGRPNVFVGLTIIATGLAAVLHPVSSLFSPGFSALQRAELGIGGGAVGFALFDGLSQFVTPFGAWFLLLLFIIAGFLIMLNTSLSFLFQASESAAKASKNALAKKDKASGLDQAPSYSGAAFAVNEAGSKPASTPMEPKPAPLTPLNSTQVLSNAAGESVVWDYPPLSLLSNQNSKGEPGDIKATAAVIERTLESFGIQAKVVEVNIGPTVTQYALELASGTKIAKITTLSNDLALAVAAKSGAVRVEAPIPGKSLVGIEIPNNKSAVVSLRSIIESEQAKAIKSRLILPLGLSVNGDPVVADLARMPHLLVAGSTGSGKSVAINAFISSMLFHNSPSELKLILVDPKFVELTGYNGIPHLLAPVITENDKVVSALKWATGEMDRRYKKLAEVGARNIEGFNEMSGFQALPYIVIIIDELSDLMMTAPAEVEDAIVRIAQKARAVGIHLILATQRPSSDIITGLIKANIPARIAFNVSSNTDSRVIMDHPGAEKLLGKGDMLFLPPDAAKPLRIQGNWIKDEEIKKMLDHIKGQGVEPEFTNEVLTTAVMSGPSMNGSGGGGGADRDPLFADAVRLICASDKASSSLMQRRLSVGYARAARILDQLEEAGVVGQGEGSKPREVLRRDVDAILGGGAAPAEEY